jgi:filamentous hemagglutinin
MSTARRVLRLVLVAALALAALAPAEARRRRSREAPPAGDRVVVRDAVVIDFGRVHYRGDVDLTPTLERVRRGERYPHRDDGTVFKNFEGRLPPRPRGYYHEYVVPTEGLRGPGPQRVILGDGGDVWYTGDHYASFRKVQ